MIDPVGIKNKRVAVLGLGRSGRSVAQALLRVGATVLAWDDQESGRKAGRENNIPLTDLTTVDWTGIDHLVLSPGIPHHYPAPHPVVAQAQIAGIRPISDMELLFQSQPDARFIGITGTNGKSTTTTLVGHILKQNQVNVQVGGNLGIPVLELNPLGSEGTYLLEVSSYQLEISPTLHFNISLLLNISPDHLDRHGGMDGYIAAKKLIYRNATVQDLLIISIDDPYCAAIYESLKDSQKLRVLPISIHQFLEVGISVKNGTLFENGQAVLDLNEFVSLKGQHNWQNAAAAYAALRAMDLESETIHKGFSSFPGLAHRQQIVTQHQNITFINDSKATNAEAVSKALMCHKDAPIYWLVGGRQKEGGISSLKPFFHEIQHAFPYGEAASNFAITLEGKVPFTRCSTLEEAIERSTHLALQEKLDGAIILLSPACASFDQFQDFEKRGDVFCQHVKQTVGNEHPISGDNVCSL